MGQNLIDFEILGLLSAAPSKKYVRKLFEFAYMFRNKLHSFEEFMETPVSTQMPQDLNLDEKKAHLMIYSIVGVLEQAEQTNWDQQAIQNIFPGSFEPKLSQLITDTILALSPLCDKLTNREICQADALIDIDWRVDVQIQTHNQQKFETLNVQTVEKNNVTMQLNSNEVNILHSHLKKIKEQLLTLVQ